MPRSGTSTRCLGREESSFRGYPFDDGKQVFGEQGSHEDRGHPVLAIEYQRRGNDAGRIVPAEGDQRPHRGVVDRRVSDVVVDHEVLRFVLLRISDSDTEELHTALTGGLVDLFEVVGFAAAGATPLTPEIDHDDLSVVVRQSGRLALLHQIGAGELAYGSACFGRVVDDVGSATGRDEVEAPAGRCSVGTSGASGDQ